MKASAILIGSLVGLLLGLVCSSYAVIRNYSGNKNVEVIGDFTFEDDHEIGFLAPRNGQTVRRHLDSGIAYHLNTDQRGARVNRPGEQSLPRVDVVTIGCSFSWGHGIENEQTYSSLLEQGMGLTVANLSLGSYGTVQSLLLLRRNLDLRPRFVIYGFIDDHIRRNLTPCAPSYAPLCLATPYVTFNKAGKLFIHPPWELNTVQAARRFYLEVANETFNVTHLLWGWRVMHDRLMSPNPSWGPYERFASTRFLVNELRETVRTVGAQLVIVYIPLLDRDRTASPPPELIDALTSDIVFLDMSPIIAEHYRNPHNPLLRFERDSHPNERAHQLIALNLSKVLEPVILSRQPSP